MLLKKVEDYNLFWQDYFESYIIELSHNTSEDTIDLEYFLSNEYQDVIEAYGKRVTNPIDTLYLVHDCKVGFVIYQVIDQAIYLMEYTIFESFRKQGLGSRFIAILESELKAKAYHSIELTPTNEMNKSFWLSQGFIETTEKDEDGKSIYRKKL